MEDTGKNVKGTCRHGGLLRGRGRHGRVPRRLCAVFPIEPKPDAAYRESPGKNNQEEETETAKDRDFICLGARSPGNAGYEDVLPTI
jgi:hypothetical protein